MSTVSTTINHGITFGNPGYLSPLTVTSQGAVKNNGTGQAIFGGNATVVNYGGITATGNSGGYGYRGVYLGGGYVNNHGTITASGDAVLLQGAGSVVNSGLIYGDRWGISGRGLLSITNTGTISGSSEGIVLFAGGLITNSDLIAGADGVGIDGAAGTVVNSGTVVGTYGAAVNLSGGGTISNTGTGLISSGGHYAGITVSGGAGSVVNSGTIDGYIGVQFAGTYNDTLTDSGTIIGTGGAAVVFGSGNDLMQFQPGTLLIAGTVDGGGGTNTLEFAAGTGTLTGQGADFVDFSQGTVDTGGQWSIGGNVTLGAGIDLTISGNLSVAGTLDNAGGITVASYHGLQLSPSGYLVNETGGSIVGSGGSTRFSPLVFGATGGYSTIRNLGTITNVDGDVGVYLASGGTITNGTTSDTTALIYGNVSIYVTNGRGTVTNFGTIEANPSDGGPAMELNSGGLVVNGASGATAASILGVQYGVFGVSGPLTLTNFGTIANSNSGFGVYNRSGVSTVTNAGVIRAGNGTGVGVALGGGGTVVDSGSIAGAAAAVSFGGTGSNLLVLENGYAMSGVVLGSASAANTLELVGTVGTAVTATYNSLGLVNFQTVAFGPGASNAATLVITNDGQLPGTIAGFTSLHDAIDLTALSDSLNDASTSFNATTDVLTVTGDNGSVQLQLDDEDYGGLGFLATNDGSGGTLLTPVAALPPTIGGTVAGQAVSDDASDQPFAAVTISDLNPIPQAETITITLRQDGLATDANGTLSGTGLTKTGVGTYTLSAATPAAAEGALQALVFTPTAHEVAPGDTVTTQFVIAITDAIGQTASDTTTSVVATAVNDPPIITGPPDDIGVPGQTDTTPFAGLAVVDPDVGHIDTVTVTLSNAAGGTLSNLGGGSYAAETGVYTVTGSADAVTAALQGLTFTPAAPTEGLVGTTSFTVSVTGPGGSATNNGISVTSAEQVLGLAGTPTGDVVVSVSPDGSNFAAPAQGKINEAVVSAPSDGATYTLPDDYQAAFLGGSANATLTDTSGGNALLVGNSGNDTITSSAANDTILGGAGQNVLSASGTNDVIGASGVSTVNTSGANATVFGGTMALTATDTGTGDVLGLSTGPSNVTLGGSGATLYANTGSATITDSGTDDAIGGYTGPMALTLNGTGTSVFGGSGTLSVDMTSLASGVAIGTGDGAATITAGGANASVYGGSGSLDVDVTGPDALIGSGVGTATISINGSNTTVFGGPGVLSVDVEAGATGALIGLGSGQAFVTLAGTGTEIFGGSGSFTVDDAGSADTIAAGTGTTTIMEHGSDGVVVGSSGNLSVTGGAGAATVFGGTGHTTVNGGTGATTLFGSEGGDLTFRGSVGGATYQAGLGNETLDASLSTTANIINGGIDVTGRNALIGGSGKDSMFAGTGADTFTGGGGNNEFVFYKSVIAETAPTDVITDFNSNDIVILVGYGTTEAANALGGAVSGGGSTTIILSDHTHITFSNISSVSGLSGHVFST